MQSFKDKIIDKVLLLIQLPLYPIVYFFLNRELQTKVGRERLYLRSVKYIPFRRLLFFVLDKLFLKASENYSRPSYDGLAGYILDLKYAIAHSSFTQKIFHSNYSHTLSNIEKLTASSDGRKVSIIDFGCGAGVLTRAIASQFTDAHVIGLDIRSETMNSNSILYKAVEWGLVSSLDKYLINQKKMHTILICNGVINFMTEQEINSLLSKKIESITWFYYANFVNPEKEYQREEVVLSKESNDVHYNVPLLLRRYGYSFDYKLVPSATSIGYFVHGISKLNH